MMIHVSKSAVNRHTFCYLEDIDYTDTATLWFIASFEDKWPKITIKAQLTGWGGQTPQELPSDSVKQDNEWLSPVLTLVECCQATHPHREYSHGQRQDALPTKSNSLGRACVPMCNKSLKPFVTRRAVLSPSLSSSALVATVVPIRIQPIREVSTGCSRGKARPVSCRNVPKLLIPIETTMDLVMQC